MNIRQFISLTCLTALSAPLAAQEKAPAQAAPQEIAALIAALGSDEFAAREAAAGKLALLGSAALEAVKQAAKHPNREIRYRSQRIVGVILEREAERRLQAFLNKTEGPADRPLAGWSRFRERYGDSEHGRSLFVTMHRANAELMASLEAGPRSAAELLTRQVARDHQALQFGGQNLDLGEIAATLFAAAEPDISLPSHTLEALFSHCYQPSFGDTLTNGDYMPLARQMLGRVILRSEDRSAVQAMHVASRYNLPEGITAAKRVLERQEGVEATSMTQVALMTVAQLGDSSHLPLVERLLQNSSELSRFQDNTTTYVVELRDVALAAAVMLTRQDLKTYFAVPAQHPPELQLIFFDPRVVGFASEAERTAVFARWAKYKAGQTLGN